MNCYGTLTLIEHSPPASLVEPLTLAEVKNYLRLPTLSPADTDDDDLLETLIIAARETAEIYQQRDLVRKTYLLVLDDYPLDDIRLRAPLISVTRIRYRDSTGAWTTTTEGTDYIVDTAKQPGVVMPVYAGTWPSFTAWPTSAVEIEFISGYNSTEIFWGSSGQRILKGMKLLVSHWFNNREAFSIGLGLPQELPLTVTALLGMGAIPNV